MTLQRFIVAAAVVGLAVLTIALLISSLTAVHNAPISTFQRTGDPRKIVVNVTIGLGTEIAERNVREDASTVTVAVGVRQMQGTYPAVAFEVPVLVSLKDPLGDRPVRDADGHAVRDLGEIYRTGATPRP
jgi:hypothetical protein